MKIFKYQFVRVYFILILLALLIPKLSFSQAAKSSDYQNNPEWVKMMSDPNVNYFDAVNAYNEYWKHHEKPSEEEELMGENEDGERDHKKQEKREERENKKKSRNKTLTDAEMKELEWKREMTYQCKRFKDWMATVKPYVQSDGHILTEEERMSIYNKRQEELNKNNK